jgi:hypothetical protein
VEEASLRASGRVLLAGDLLPAVLRLLLLTVASFVLLRLSGWLLVDGLFPASLRVAALLRPLAVPLLLPAAASFALLRFSFADVPLRPLFVRRFSGVLLRLLSGRLLTDGELFPASLCVAALLRLRTVFAGGRESWLIRPLRVFFENSRLGGRPLLPGM